MSLRLAGARTAGGCLGRLSTHVLSYLSSLHLQRYIGTAGRYPSGLRTRVLTPLPDHHWQCYIGFLLSALPRTRVLGWL